VALYIKLLALLNTERVLDLRINQSKLLFAPPLIGVIPSGWAIEIVKTKAF
jgi:hypothetical protein